LPLRVSAAAAVRFPCGTHDFFELRTTRDPGASDQNGRITGAARAFYGGDRMIGDAVGVGSGFGPGADACAPHQFRNIATLIGIERGRASRRWRVSILAPSVCKVGSQFHLNHVSRGPPIIPDGRVSQVRFEVLAYRQ
jgi:hypothetical protein